MFQALTPDTPDAVTDLKPQPAELTQKVPESETLKPKPETGWSSEAVYILKI